MSTQDLPLVAAQALYDAFERGEPIDPVGAISVDEAYAVQREVVALHEAAGRTVVGRKIGLTSLAMQEQLGIDSPDFGVVLDSHTFREGARLSRSELRMIAPRLEPELAFVLSRELAGDVSAADVLEATAAVVPVFEVIDSRIRDWKIGLSDTVADNASCFGVVLGEPVPLPASLADVPVRFTQDGELRQEGVGAAVMGDPAQAVAWLARELSARGDVLPAGEPILAGSFTAAIDAVPGHYEAEFGGVGSVSVEVVA